MHQGRKRKLNACYLSQKAQLHSRLHLTTNLEQVECSGVRLQAPGWVLREWCWSTPRVLLQTFRSWLKTIGVLQEYSGVLQKGDSKPNSTGVWGWSRAGAYSSPLKTETPGQLLEFSSTLLAICVSPGAVTVWQCAASNFKAVLLTSGR
jgi:hypothetical protein